MVEDKDIMKELSDVELVAVTGGIIPKRGVGHNRRESRRSAN